MQGLHSGCFRRSGKTRLALIGWYAKVENAYIKPRDFLDVPMQQSDIALDSTYARTCAFPSIYKHLTDPCSWPLLLRLQKKSLLRPDDTFAHARGCRQQGLSSQLTFTTYFLGEVRHCMSKPEKLLRCPLCGLLPLGSPVRIVYVSHIAFSLIPGLIGFRV